MSDDAADGAELNFLARRGSVYTVATAVQLSIYLLVLPAVTRSLAPAEFGVLTAALVVVQLLTYVAAMGLPYALTLDYFDQSTGEGAARLLVLVTAAFATLIALLADLTGPRWSQAVFTTIDYGPAMRFAVWSAVPFAVLLSAQALLRSADLATRFVVITILGTIGAQSAGLVAVWLYEPEASAFMAGYLGVLSVAGLAGVLLSHSVRRYRGDVPPRDVLRRGLALGVPTVPHALAMYLLVAGDRVIIERIEGLDSVARYQVAYLVGALGITLAGAINNAWGPVIYGAPASRRWSVLNSTEAEITAVGALAVAGIALGAPYLLALLAPSDYDPAALAPVTAIVALCTLPYITYLADAHVIFFERRPWLFAWMTPLTAAANLLMAAVLVRVIGLIGAAVASFLAYVVMATLVAVARRALIDEQRDWAKLWPWWVVGAAGAGAGALLPSSGVVAGLRLLVCSVIGVVALRRIRAIATGGGAAAPLR